MSSTDPFCRIPFSRLINDASPRVDIDPWRDETERRIAQKHTHRQILDWLAGEGVIVGKNTFSSQMVAWDASRQTRTAGTNTLLIKEVERAFYTTNHSD